MVFIGVMRNFFINSVKGPHCVGIKIQDYKVKILFSLTALGLYFVIFKMW